jgi:hypothetical protein
MRGWIATLVSSIAEIMNSGVDTGLRDVGILAQIPVGIE